MSGFAFPPPPPPPPRATSESGSASAQPEVYGQRHGRGCGGDRGRGRGRGRGGNNRGGYGNRGGRGHLEGGARSNTTAPVPGGPLPSQTPYGQVPQPQQPTSHFPVFPTGGYINPAFTPFSAVSQQQWSSPMYTASLNPSLSPQQSWLQSLMQNQTNGMAQKQNIDAGNAPNENGTPPDNAIHPPSNAQHQRNDHSRNSRGRGAALAGGANPRQRSTAAPKVQAAPAVPSFGFSLPTVKPEIPIAAGAPDKAQGTKKRKFNQLGLTPRSEVHADSEEEDVDEEQKFANPGGVLQFEYKGRSSTLKSPEEIAAWIEERKKRFPTKARVEEKAKLDAEKKEARQQMTNRVNAEKTAAREKSVSDKRKKQKTQPETNDDDRRRETMEKHLRKAEKLRKQLQQAEKAAARAAKPAGQDCPIKAKSLEAGPNSSLGLAYDSEASHDEKDESEDDGSSVISSSSEDISSDSDDTSDDSDDSDAPPDEETSVKRPIKVAPPPRKPREGPPQPKSARKERQKEQPKRQTLRDRWVEQEKREETKRALQAIKFLGESGFLG